jgi:hypothetical protein
MCELNNYFNHIENDKNYIIEAKILEKAEIMDDMKCDSFEYYKHKNEPIILSKYQEEYLRIWNELAKPMRNRYDNLVGY